MIRAGQAWRNGFIGECLYIQSQEVKELLKKELAAYTEQDVVAAYYAETEGLDDITRMQYIGINFWMRGDILRKIGPHQYGTRSGGKSSLPGRGGSRGCVFGSRPI